MTSAKFMASCILQEEKLSSWTCQFLALQMYGYFTGTVAVGRARELIRSKYTALMDRHHAPSAEAPQPLSVERAKLQARFRECCKDGLNLGIVMLGDVDNKIRQRIIMTGTMPTRVWHGVCSSKTRSVDENYNWALGQAKGGYWDHLVETLSVWSDLEKISFCGMCVSLSAADLDRQLEDPFFSEQDDWATMLGTYTLNLCGHRLRRTLWLLRGWPAKAILMSDAEAGPSAVELFKADEARFNDVVAPLTSRHGRTMQRRSVFKQPAVTQISKVLQINGWDCNRDGAHSFFMRRSRAGMVTTLVAEESFKRQRIEQDKGYNNECAEERTWLALLNRHGIMSNEHRYKPVPDTLNVSRATRFTKDVYYPTVKGNGHPSGLTGVAGFASSPAWFSPTPFSMNAIYGDLEVSAFCERTEQLDVIDHSFLATLLRSPNLIVRREGSCVNMFSLGDVAGQSGLGWPAGVGSDFLNGGVERLYYWPLLDAALVRELNWIVVVNINEWRATPFRFASPARMMREALEHHGDANLVPGDRKQILAIATGPEDTLLRTVALNCVAGLALDFLVRLARFLGCEGPVDTMFNVCSTLLLFIFPGEDEGWYLNILEKRLWTTAPNIEELLAVDAALDVLAPDDRHKLESEQSKQSSHEVSKRAYRDSYSRRRQAHRERAGGGEGSGGGGAGGGAGAAGGAARPSIRAWHDAPDMHIEQSAVNLFMPQGASVWRDGSRRKWHFHPRPASRFHRKWDDYGEAGAAWRGVRECWRLYKAMKLITPADCPFDGIFDDDGDGPPPVGFPVDD